MSGTGGIRKSHSPGVLTLGLSAAGELQEPRSRVVWVEPLGSGGAQPDLTSQLIVTLSQLLITGEQQRAEMRAWEGGWGQMWTAVCGLLGLGCGV